MNTQTMSIISPQSTSQKLIALQKYVYLLAPAKQRPAITPKFTESTKSDPKLEYAEAYRHRDSKV